MTHFHDTFETELGPFSVAVDETGAVAATAFGGEDRLKQRFDPELLTPDVTRTDEARSQIIAFLAGELQDFTLPLSAKGTAFQQAVWAELRQIPMGETRSYGAIAAKLGLGRAARAVGRANGSNPICLIVPCHRVIGADGSLTGFAFGQEIKRRLLEHEARMYRRG